MPRDENASDTVEALIACALLGHEIIRSDYVEFCVNCWRDELAARPINFGSLSHFDASIVTAVIRNGR